VDRARAISGVITAAAAALLLSGCAGPEYTYVRDADGGTYFKVPSAWKKVDQKALEGQLFGDPESATAQVQKQLTWSVAYDAQAQPSADHLLVGAGGADDQPFVMAKVQTLTEPQRNQVSLDSMRNAIGLPVAVPDDTRKQMESAAEYPFKNFELLDDQVLPTQDGVRGVRSVFNFRLANGVQTFDETSYLSADGSRISTLLIRCSAACYRQRSGEIDQIAQSFKVTRLLNQ
jgi:hypothetical protein